MEIINVVVAFYDLLKFQDRRRKKFVFVVDKTELPVPFVVGAGKDTDLFVSQIPFQKPQRDHCQAAVDLYGIENSIRSSFLKGSPDMKMMPCSFDNQELRWAVDLRTHSMEEAWRSAEFEAFREHFRRSCPDCDIREGCMGGCPIRPEIVLCGRHRKKAEGAAV